MDINEPELIKYYYKNKNVFMKSDRKTKERSEIKERFGVSDEQLEGWFKMFGTNVYSFY